MRDKSRSKMELITCFVVNDFNYEFDGLKIRKFHLIIHSDRLSTLILMTNHNDKIDAKHAFYHIYYGKTIEIIKNTFNEIIN